MDNREALQILEQLAEGMDPITGNALPEQHVCNEPLVIRALYKAIRALANTDGASPALQQPAPSERSSRANRVNNNNPWTSEEDTYLRHAHHCGATYEQMSAQLLRSPRVIQYRAIFLGLADSRIIDGRSIPPLGRERQGLPWYPEEDEQLVQMFSAGCRVQDIAAKLKRSPSGIERRLEKHGLIEAHPSHRHDAIHKPSEAL